jgi:uncharacterized cupredoxin-like copper-binding protein
VKRRNWIWNWVPMKKQHAHLFPQLMGRVLVLVLALLIVVCIDIGTSIATHSTPTTPTSLTLSRNTISQNTIHYDNIQEAAKPGSVKVEVTLAEFTIVSSVATFHAGIPYYFVVANRGQQVHEFLILPVKPDGSPQSGMRLLHRQFNKKRAAFAWLGFTPYMSLVSFHNVFADSQAKPPATLL